MERDPLSSSFSDLTAQGRPIHQGDATCRAPPCHGVRTERPQGVAYRQTSFQLGCPVCKVLLYGLYSTTFFWRHEYGSYIQLLGDSMATQRVVQKNSGSSRAKDGVTCCESQPATFRGKGM